MARVHVVFARHTVQTGKNLSYPAQTITAGVWIDLDALAELVIKASRNKGRKAKDGAINVEVHTIERGK